MQRLRLRLRQNVGRFSIFNAWIVVREMIAVWTEWGGCLQAKARVCKHCGVNADYPDAMHSPGWLAYIYIKW